MSGTQTRRRNSRLEVRTTLEERDLIDKAIEVAGTDLTAFVVGSALTAARRVLADRERFVLDEQGRGEWERVNSRPARDLPALRRLMERPSPFTG